MVISAFTPGSPLGHLPPIELGSAPSEHDRSAVRGEGGCRLRKVATAIALVVALGIGVVSSALAGLDFGLDLQNC
jgi:hypothetical protein